MCENKDNNENKATLLSKQQLLTHKCFCLWPHCWKDTFDRKHRWKRHHTCTKHYHRRHSKSKSWIPPINFHTLEELSIHYIFKSIQLRHDLLFDPNLRFRPNLDGPIGRVKRSQMDRYWHRVDRAFKSAKSFDFLRPIVKEICRILVSLIDPFDHHLSLSHHIPWFWPTSVTQAHIYEALDADLIIQQLTFNHEMTRQIQWLRFIFESLLKKGTTSVDLMLLYFEQKQYAKALQQCFSILEAIKLSCANLILVYYRQFLIDTCPEFEYQCYMRTPFNLSSVTEWLQCTSRRCGSTKSIYYRGLIHLIADDECIVSALNLETFRWPVTLQFDKARLTGQFRKDFQHLVNMSVLIIAYRHLIKESSDEEEGIQRLKEAYLNNKDVGALLIQSPFWQDWLLHNLKATSVIYKLMYERICHQLIFATQYGKTHDSMPIEITFLKNEICTLGKKLKLLADLNLKTYGSIYRNVCQSLI